MPKCEVFRADHPFIFVIRHNATGEILFMGRMANPGGPNAAVTSQPATAEALFVHSRPVRSIVFVIDRSGSMVDSFDALKEAILAHVCDRRPNQAFHIIMFGGERQAPIEMAGKKLVPATKASKQMAAEFLESMNATGTTDPKPAIKRAFEVLAGPDAKDGKLIVFLAGSDFGEDNEKVLALIKKLNPDREVMISPYLYSEHETKAGKELLEKIAQDNGGKYKFFSTNEAK